MSLVPVVSTEWIGIFNACVRSIALGSVTEHVLPMPRLYECSDGYVASQTFVWNLFPMQRAGENATKTRVVVGTEQRVIRLPVEKILNGGLNYRVD